MKSLAFVSFCLAQSLATEPNPPTWPSSVVVFGPDDTDIEATVDAAFAINGGHDPDDNGQFSDARFAFLFKPGTYSADVPVGYYTQVLGLGESPDDVTFEGPKGVYCEEGSYSFTTGSLNTFWRSAENFKSESTYPWWSGATGMLWAVSQASPLRRVHVASDLLLFQYTYGDAAGYASGGFMGNSLVDGTVQSGSQQQWLTRNCEIGGWSNGVWNMVFVGTENAPDSHCGLDESGGQPYVTVDETPVVAEKPFLTIDDSGMFYLNIPQVTSTSSGVDWSSSSSGSGSGSTGAASGEIDQVSFSEVYVASNATDTAAMINAKLAEGLHLVLTPGIYSLDAALEVSSDNQVILGIGLATIIPTAGTPAITVKSNLDGVRVAGVLLQAGSKRSDVLLEWGTEIYGGDASNPGCLSDVFVRVGGPDYFETFADVILSVKTGHVIGDNLWLWRADHSVSGSVYNGENPCYHGAVIDADDVTMYGLAVEHTLSDLTQWNGDRGRSYFYQSELPYDVTQEGWGDAGYVGYRVADNITSHQAFGAGVYHYFRDNNVTTYTGIVAPDTTANFTSPVGVFLNGLGTMEHVLNDQGSASGPYEPTDVPGAHVVYICDEMDDDDKDGDDDTASTDDKAATDDECSGANPCAEGYYWCVANGGCYTTPDDPGCPGTLC